MLLSACNRPYTHMHSSSEWEKVGAYFKWPGESCQPVDYLSASHWKLLTKLQLEKCKTKANCIAEPEDWT